MALQKARQKRFGAVPPEVLGRPPPLPSPRSMPGWIRYWTPRVWMTFSAQAGAEAALDFPPVLRPFVGLPIR